MLPLWLNISKRLPVKHLQLQQNQAKKTIVLNFDLKSANPEAYQIKVTSKQITISTASETGVFYGIQTLRKSLPIGSANVTLPAFVINDAPRFGYR
jgi:hexosaminidase